MIKEDLLCYYMYLSRVKGIGNVRFNQILKKNKRLKINIKEFFESFSKELFQYYPFINNLSKEMISQYPSQLDEDKRVLEKCIQLDAQPISILDKAYPQRINNSLGLNAPPIIYVKGNLALLNEDSNNLAIVGTRKPSIIGSQLSQKVASFFSNKIYNIISGYAKGIDLTAHNTALAMGGNTIFVLGYGIFQFSDKAIINRNLLDSHSIILSEFYPNHPLCKGFLMARNKTICALSDAVFVVESINKGGSYHSGKNAILMNKPVYTFTGNSQVLNTSGNEKLIGLGARAISLEKEYEASLLKKLSNIDKELKNSDSEGFNQLSLF